jgi:fructose-1,6-bisphosphatase I
VGVRQRESQQTMGNSFITIERHIASMQRGFPEARGEFSGLLSDIACATKIIASHVNRAGLTDIIGETGEENIQGERVQKLDAYADDTMVRLLSTGGHVCVMGSEERDDPIIVDDPALRGPYAVLFDPLDGSSNIDVNAAIGTIFTIFRRKTADDETPGAKDLLQRGTEIVAAGYVVYGSSTMLVYSAGLGVHGFTLDPRVGEFLLSHENIRTPEAARIYSVNEGHRNKWPARMQQLVDSYKEAGLTQRYIGSLVADFHRNLLKGGVFLYPSACLPGDSEARPKLRLLYEAAPLAYLAHQAGGYASDGESPILDRLPKSLHERVQLILGSADITRAAEAWLRKPS